MCTVVVAAMEAFLTLRPMGVAFLPQQKDEALKVTYPRP